MKEHTYTYVEATLPEVVDVGYESGVEQMVHVDRMVEALSGTTGDKRETFRVPAADNKTDLFFYNLELLARYTSMSTPIQRQFLESLRATMERTKQALIQIPIKWGSSSMKTLAVLGHIGDKDSPYGGHMDFELMP